MKATGSRPRIVVSAGGRGVAGHVGTRLLADVADATGLCGQFSDALAHLRQRRRGHDPGRVALDLAVMLVDGGEAIADVAVLRDQPALFGSVASDATAWRILSNMDSAGLARLRSARAAAREVAWAQLAETRGEFPKASRPGSASTVWCWIWTPRSVSAHGDRGPGAGFLVAEAAGQPDGLDGVREREAVAGQGQGRRIS